MNEDFRCPKCGQPVPPDAPEGLCPRCVAAVNLDSASGVGGAGAAPTSPPPSAQELAPLFPQLEILELLGQGGMGVVYKVRQKELDRLAALKILPPGTGGDPAFAERFTREAKALARLNHAGIVTIYDFGRTDGLFYFLMEFVDGVHLGRLMRGGRVSPREALAIVPPICDALQYAHDQGIVHRDIKPENILLDRQGRVKVADFGLAKLIATGREPTEAGGTGATGSVNLTAAGKVMGTPRYMAPEQAEHPGEVDHRADIYALGVVFYQMLTGELPAQRLEPPSKRVQIDVRLDEVVLRALEKEPQRRYQQVSEVKTAVEAIASTPQGPGTVPSTAQWKINWLPALVFYSLQAALVVPLEWSFLHKNWSAFLLWLILDFLALIAAYATWGRVHYLCWKALPERYRSSTPGESVGFLFIPFFNFYWAFISFPKLAGGFNAMRAAHPELPLRDMKGLGIAKAVLFVSVWTIAFVPRLNAVTCLADLVVFILFYRGIVANAKRCADIPATPQGRVESGEQQLSRTIPAEASPDEAVRRASEQSSRGTLGTIILEAPRFSRTAIVGAVWAAFLLLMLLVMFMPWTGAVTRYSGPAWWRAFCLFLFAHNLPMFNPESPQWQMYTLLPLGLTAPFGAAVLGWGAIAQIRRSAGTLRGLWLALVDSAVLPLLLLGVSASILLPKLLQSQSVSPVAQQEQPAQETRPRLVSPRTVEEVLARYTQGRGGSNVVQATTTLAVDGTFESRDGLPKLKLEALLKAPDKWWMGLTGEQGPIWRRAFDGTDGWEISKWAGTIKVDPVTLLTARILSGLYLGEPPASFLPNLTLKGKETVANREVCVLEVAVPQGQPPYLWFDSQTGLLIRIQYGVNGSQMQLDLDDYRCIDGLMLPFTLRQTGSENWTVRCAGVKRNEQLDDDAFKKPSQ